MEDITPLSQKQKGQSGNHNAPFEKMEKGQSGNYNVCFVHTKGPFHKGNRGNLKTIMPLSQRQKGQSGNHNTPLQRIKGQSGNHNAPFEKAKGAIWKSYKFIFPFKIKRGKLGSWDNNIEIHLHKFPMKRVFFC